MRKGRISLTSPCSTRTVLTSTVLLIMILTWDITIVKRLSTRYSLTLVMVLILQHFTTVKITIQRQTFTVASHSVIHQFHFITNTHTTKIVSPMRKEKMMMPGTTTLIELSDWLLNKERR